MIGEHTALDLILQASPIVQFAMALLVAASVVSWAIIIRKQQLLKAADNHSKNAYGDYLRMVAEQGVPNAL